MVKSELIKRSPLRILEKSIQGGLGKGNIGILASRKGVGKTACLVHIATDKLLQNKPVIHVSYSSRVDYIINWYEDIFKEIAKKRQLESAVDVHDEIIKNRVIMNFKQDGVNTEQVLKSLTAMIEYGKFAADAIIVDGFDFTQSCSDDLDLFKNFAEKLGLEVWFSASLKGEEPLFNESGVPFLLEGCLGKLDVLITLRFEKDHVQLNLVKDPEFSSTKNLDLKLDPKTLLISEHGE
ncbi:MAG: hypothetical protein KAU46_02880 [Candidatus Aminicenantes bacterium]|nr:hypothetical protein [Candidatus Aminicenantes bacterium]